MVQAIVELVLDEGNWIFASMVLSIVVIVVVSLRHRRTLVSDRSEILLAMNLFYGCLMGTMAFGHLLAVTIKIGQGTLQGSWQLLYPLGLVLAIPAWWLAFRVARYVVEEDRYRNRMVALNAWLGICLLGLGVHNFPLAAPAALNIAYQFHTKRAVGWTIVTVAITANVALLVGSLVFLASGQSFEQFQGME